MQYSIVLTGRSRAIRVAAPTIQRLCVHAHVRGLNTVGPRAAPDHNRLTTDQTDSEGLRHKKSSNRNAAYIGSGLVGLGAIWYYYAMMEGARIGDVDVHKTGVEGGDGGRSVEDVGRMAKERAQEAIKVGDAKYQDTKAEAQSKVQATKDQIGRGIEGGKQRFEEAKDQAAHRASEDRAAVGK
jgi:hypothetical protein